MRGHVAYDRRTRLCRCFNDGVVGRRSQIVINLQEVITCILLFPHCRASLLWRSYNIAAFPYRRGSIQDGSSCIKGGADNVSPFYSITKLDQERKSVG